MVYFIVICVVAFLFVILLVNFPKIKELFKNRPKTTKIKQPKVKEDPDIVPKKENISYDEKTFKQKFDEGLVVDNLDRDDLKVESFVNITEDEIKELDSKKQALGGRKTQQLSSNTTEQVEYPDLGTDDDDLHDMYDFANESEISEEIKNLSPELKAILISNLLNRRDDI